ncbi:hypothetical protein [Rhizobium mayense]|nr:hypothetical protein [Rhizobium mayense]
MIAIPEIVSAQQMPNSDRCTGPGSNSQTEGKQTAPRSQGSTSQELSDCGGVLKPPATGDNGLEKPAPRDGKTPVIPPGDGPDTQENNTPQAK